jgi:hypothetical protein
MQEEEVESKEKAHEEAVHEIKAIMFEYILKVNSRYRANEFTSSQLTKRIMTTMEVEKTRFPILHHLVKETLRTWEDQGLCTHISCTKYSRCRKTKDTYRFSARGIREIKKQTIEETIKTIGEGELSESPIMRSRETIIRDRLEELLNNMSITDNQALQEGV